MKKALDEARAVEAAAATRLREARKAAAVLRGQQLLSQGMSPSVTPLGFLTNGKTFYDPLTKTLVELSPEVAKLQLQGAQNMVTPLSRTQQLVQAGKATLQAGKTALGEVGAEVSDRLWRTSKFWQEKGAVDGLEWVGQRSVTIQRVGKLFGILGAGGAFGILVTPETLKEMGLQQPQEII